MVVLAVSREPLSNLQFPANREFNREIVHFWPSFTHGADGMLHNSRRLGRWSGRSRLKKNREFFRGNRELKFPVTGSSSEILFIFLWACR
jgi:hypothetical protein